MTNPHHKRNGAFLAIGAYVIWGLVPLYYVPAKNIPAFEMLLHRAVWTSIACIPACFALGLWPDVKRGFTDRKTLLALIVTGLLIGTNWVIFMWAMTHERVIDTSLGYFINPLLFVLLGVAFLRERLRPAQTLSVALAATGVGILIWRTGQLPWVSLALPSFFAVYGLIRRYVTIHTVAALFVETVILVPIAVAYWIYLASRGESSFTSEGWFITGWFILLGPVTLVPLAMFGAAAKRISLTAMGFCQYIAPSMTFFFGIVYFHEPFETVRFITFAVIWVSLAIFTFDNLMIARPTLPPAVEAEA